MIIQGLLFLKDEWVKVLGGAVVELSERYAYRAVLERLLGDVEGGDTGLNAEGGEDEEEGNSDEAGGSNDESDGGRGRGRGKRGRKGGRSASVKKERSKPTSRQRAKSDGNKAANAQRGAARAKRPGADVREAESPLQVPAAMSFDSRGGASMAMDSDSDSDHWDIGDAVEAALQQAEWEDEEERRAQGDSKRSLGQQAARAATAVNYSAGWDWDGQENRDDDVMRTMEVDLDSKISHLEGPEARAAAPNVSSKSAVHPTNVSTSAGSGACAASGAPRALAARNVTKVVDLREPQHTNTPADTTSLFLKSNLPKQNIKTEVSSNPSSSTLTLFS